MSTDDVKVLSDNDLSPEETLDAWRTLCWDDFEAEEVSDQAPNRSGAPSKRRRPVCKSKPAAKRPYQQ